MVGDGKISIENFSYRGDCLVDGSLPAHSGVVFDEPLPVVGEGDTAVWIEAGVIGGHHHRNGRV